MGRAERGRAPVRVRHLKERLLDGELVLYDPERQYVYALNPTAAFVWRACDGRHGAASIVAALAERYPESRREIEVDVPEIIERFRSDGLLDA